LLLIDTNQLNFVSLVPSLLDLLFYVSDHIASPTPLLSFGSLSYIDTSYDSYFQSNQLTFVSSTMAGAHKRAQKGKRNSSPSNQGSSDNRSTTHNQGYEKDNHGQEITISQPLYGLGSYDGPSDSPPKLQNPYGPGLGYDPAKPTPAKQSVITNTRMELPAAAYGLDNGVSTRIPKAF
jgi:hypothetical protein